MSKSDSGTLLFKLIGRRKLEELAKKCVVDKGDRGFSNWELTKALLRFYSYRDLEATLGSAGNTKYNRGNFK
jgi:hypothetical protein